jgi:RNA polymerase sigma-70 factor (ECF subfamily)
VYPHLARWAASATGSLTAGQDIAAEAFARLWARWSKVANPEAWLWMVATNLVKDRWRKQQRERVLESTLVLIDNGTPPPDTGLLDLVTRLPARLRLAVTLHYFADMPVSKVATTMGRPEGSVKRWLAEARAQLAIELEDQHGT